jgi:hypothetical protein
MEANTEENKSFVEIAGEDLFNFAVNREDIKALITHLHKETTCKPEAVEYELQLLKIISTGWSISFFLEETNHRDQLSESFWKSIHEFSETLSETTQLMTGQDINYFNILKERLDMYVEALTGKPEATEPVAVIGPVFAKVCGNADDIFAIMTGSKMFLITVASVKEYLEEIELQ